ncbi:hypothetical protein CMI37_03415 [Candidatus Pacearchaeota archaeon]|nr:hypothetical protein [Candidatus Pacearchaeota archaeon]
MAWYNPASWQAVDFGGTPHLEDLAEAHLEWTDRIVRFSQSPAFGPWDDQAISWAMEQAIESRDAATDAADYWQLVGEGWTARASRLSEQMDPDQLSKILGLLGQSGIAAESLSAARDAGTLGTLAAETAKATVADVGDQARARVPWALPVVGALALLALVTRR